MAGSEGREGTIDVPLLRVLGPVAAGSSRRPVHLGGPRQRAVLAVLAAHYRRTVTVDHLIDELWPERPPGGPRKTVQTYVSNLRAQLTPVGVAIDRDGDGYRLEVDERQLDLMAFDVALARASAATSDADRLDALRRATALVTGEPFANVGECRSLAVEASQVSERYLDAELRRLQLELAIGDAAAVAAEAEALAARHPWRESTWELLVTSLPAAGRASELDVVADRARTTLAAELGIAASIGLDAATARVRSLGAGARIPLPPWLARRVGDDFVGRTAEFEVLRDRFERATTSLSIVAIEGEAGIGKSRLLAEFAAMAHRSGATVLAGHCDEHVRPPFRAVIEMLGRLADHEGEAAVLARGGTEGPELARLSERFGAPPPLDDPDVQRFRLATAMGNVLRSLSREGRLVIVVDDLQWAGEPTFDWLTRLATEMADLDAMVVVTVRSAERNPAVRAFLSQLRRSGALDEIRLDGLDPDAVGRLVGAELGHEAHRYTGGNPLFVGEIALHLAAGGRIGPSDRLSDLVCQRIDRIGAGVTATLQRASIIGLGFSMDALCRFPDADPGSIAAALDRAQQHGVVRLLGVDDLTYEFTHALVGDALYHLVPPAERLLAHATLAESLEAAGAGGVAAAVEIAHHWTVAAPAGFGDRAVVALRRAAELARRSVGAHEAVVLLERADALARRSNLPVRLRVEVLVDLAAALAEAGSNAACTDRACESGALADEHGLDDLVIAAALSLTGGDVFSDPERGRAAHGLISRALRLCEPHSTTWALLRSKAMIGELIGGVTHDDELDVVLATVRREAPPAIVRQVVENVAFVATGTRHDECVDLLRRAAERDEPSTRNAHLYESLVQAIGNADGSSFRATVLDYRVTARGNHAHTFAAESAAAVVEFWDGRTRAGYRRGMQVMVDALPHRPQSSWSGAFVWAATRAFVLGRPGVLEPFARECSQRYRVAMFDGALAWVEASRGDPSRIRARVERRSPARVRALTMPRLGGPAHWMTVLACVADGTSPSIDYARELIDLADGSAFHAMPHNPSPALAQLSSRVALVEGDLDRAIDDARRAVDDYRSMTAHVFVPGALAELAGALRRRGRSADRTESDVVDAEATSAKRRLRARPLSAG